MAVPTITSLSDVIGPALGGDLVHVLGADFASNVRVLFGELEAELVRVRNSTAIDVRTPYAEPSTVPVTVVNLDGNGDPVPGEEVTEARAYTFSRTNLVRESGLARLLRALIRRLKYGVLENSGMTTSVDFDNVTRAITGQAYALNIDTAALPSLTLSNMELVENRDATDNTLTEYVVSGPSGPEVRYAREPWVADVTFDVIGAAASMAQFANLLDSTIHVMHSYRFVSIARDPEDDDAGAVEFEVDPVGITRSELAGGKDDLRVFIRPWRVRAFWIGAEDALVLDATARVNSTELVTQAL